MLSDPEQMEVATVAERRLEVLSRARVPVAHDGHLEAELVTFGDEPDRVSIAALVVGQESFSRSTPLVRLHSACFTGDVLGSLRCDCGPQLAASLERIHRHGSGVVLYLLGHEGRGIGLVRKLEAYQLQDQGLDTIDANLALGLGVDDREFESSAIVLKELGVERLLLLTNNPDKAAALTRSGLVVEGVVHLPASPNPHNHSYLRTKATRLGHVGLDADEQLTGQVG